MNTVHCHARFIYFCFASSSVSTMSWQTSCSRDYLESRVNDFLKTLSVGHKNGVPVPGATSCMFSSLATRSNGDAQLKLRWVTQDGHAKQASPRPWTVQVFLRGQDIPPGCDCSHLCGFGLQGCVNIDHIVVEPHSVNLDRKLCHMRTICPQCSFKHSVQICTHNPPCL